MKLERVRETYDYHSGKVSEIVRQLGLAGVALIWIFKVDGPDGTIRIPFELLVAARYIVAALAIDLLHYLIGTALWGLFNKFKEHQRIGEAKDFEAPGILNYPAILAFWSKVVLMGLAYWNMLAYLSSRVSGSN